MHRRVPYGFGRDLQWSRRVCQRQLHLPSRRMWSGMRDHRRGVQHLPTGVLGAVVQQAVYRRSDEAVQWLRVVQRGQARGWQLRVPVRIRHG